MVMMTAMAPSLNAASLSLGRMELPATLRARG